jgi:hypothetical protein
MTVLCRVWPTWANEGLPSALARSLTRVQGRFRPGKRALAAPPGLGGASLRLAYRAAPASDILLCAPAP